MSPGLIVLIGLFVMSILGSIVFETLLPLYRAGDLRRLALNLLGIPIVLAGTGVFVVGGVVFVRDTFRVWATLPPAGPQTRGSNAVALLRAWRSGTLILLGGFALIAVGGFIINL